MKKLLAIILSITILLSMGTVAFAEETTTPGAREVKGIIKVGVNAEFPPFEYVENDKMIGFDIDLMNCIAARIGYSVEFVNMSFDKLIPAVVNGEVDCAISAISVIEERDSVIDYSREYLKTQNITFENGQKKIQFGETYAIVFREGLADSPYKSITTPTDDEALYIMIDNALRDLSNDRTVMKLIEKYELNKPLDENKVNIEYSSIMGDGDPAAKTDDEKVETSATPIQYSDWAAKEIDYAYAVGIADTNKEYHFRENITREEFCELIYNLIVLTSDEITAPITDSFTDTKNDKILMLNGLGIINGKSATEFAPNDYLTREEAATIIVRMFEKGYAKINTGTTAQWITFSDEKEISDWALFSVQNIYKMGIMNGVGNNNFAPKDNYTTEQAIVTLARVFKNTEVAGGIDHNSSVGIIGGADGPTSIIVGGNTTVIEDEGYNSFYTEVAKNTTKVGKFYVDEAIKLITESGKLASDKDFISLYTTNDEMTEKVLALGAVDFNKPKDIYYLSSDREQIIANLEALAKAEGVDLKEMGDVWVEHILKRFNFSTLASLINSSYGAENLAALTILTNSRGYIMPKDFKNNFALFVQYEGDYSAIVSFSEFGDGVISANMSFVKNGDKDNVFMRMYEITSTVGEDGIKMAKVK